MQVRLISKTTGFPGTEFENKSIDEIIVGIARISSSREINELFDEPYKLIRHCITRSEWSIFDMCNLTFEVITSRAIARQLLRHSSIRPQEFSQRYAEVHTFEPIELREQCKSNRQSSTTIILGDINEQVHDYLHSANALYSFLINSGTAKETARFILPEATQTKLILNGRIREWITTLNQRLHKSSQKEMRQVAEQIKDIFIEQCPVISQALFNFEHAYDIPILDRVILEKYKIFDQVFKRN